MAQPCSFVLVSFFTFPPPQSFPQIWATMIRAQTLTTWKAASLVMWNRSPRYPSFQNLAFVDIFFYTNLNSITSFIRSASDVLETWLKIPVVIILFVMCRLRIMLNVVPARPVRVFSSAKGFFCGTHKATRISLSSSSNVFVSTRGLLSFRLPESDFAF